MDSIGIVVISLDGRITRPAEEGVSFNSAADRKYFREALQEFDCCVLGAKTFLASKTGILANLSPERLRIVLTRHPVQYTAYHQPGLLEFINASPQEVMADLQRRNKHRCAVLGGGEIYALFLTHHLLDELWITVEPLIFGAGKLFVPSQIDVQLSLKECVQLSEDTLLLKYAVQR